MSTIIVKREEFSEEDWLNAMYRKSESSRTRDVASTSLRTFDLFCKNQGLQRDEMIEKDSTWFNQDKPDLRSILLSLDKFVQFMNIPHDDIFIGKVTFKKKIETTSL